jgi:Domain of unknown function (DUF4157)
MMFASRNHNQAKEPVGRRPERGDSTLDRKTSSEQNPLWQSLAMRSGTLQAKLTIGQADDPYEHEADRIADLVMRMPSPQSSGHGLSITPVTAHQAQRKCAECEEEEEGGKLQRKESSGAEAPATAPPIVHETLNSPGQPLDETTRAYFEPRFGDDFSQVRVHTDVQAAESAHSLNALAYTVANHVVFSNGSFAPATDRGKRLLAHELVHIRQQAVRTVGQGPSVHRKEGETPSGQSDTTVSDTETVCSDLRSALSDSMQLIELYQKFLDGNVKWEEMQSQRQPIGNAAQGVVGAGLDKPQIVQDAVEEVEAFGFEEFGHMGRLVIGAIGLLVNDESFQRQWATNEIERQNHYNLVLIRYMYENSCPDFPGTWAGFQEQILTIGTKGSVPSTTTVGPSRETRAALAWVEVGDEQVLVLATEVAGAGQLNFERWIDSDFRELALRTAGSKQGSIPAVPSSAVIELPTSVPSSAARK